MKTLFLQICLLCGIFTAYSQRSPVLKTGNQYLNLTSLDIKVTIIGNIATTTYEMVFYNPSNRVLEGQLVFPLGEGHHVSRFALDIRGKLREAVVVDKELGRIAFEAVVRRRVDPALLEKGTGNNYTARIYPIPAHGTKRVLLAYEQELTLNGNNHYYQLPLNFKNSIADFNLDITVFDQMDAPVLVKGGVLGEGFKQWEQQYSLKVAKKNYSAHKNVLIKIPMPMEIEKLQTYNTYFYLYKRLKKQDKLREKPKTITLLWDTSLSLKTRNLEKEMSLLDAYFMYLKDVKVCFVGFSNTIHSEKDFVVTNGDWSAIKEWLGESTYDGGTSYKAIENKLLVSDVTLLFSDGLSNLSPMTLKSKHPIFAINTSMVANHAGLKQMAEKSNGRYINLENRTVLIALKSLKYESYKYKGVKSISKGMQVFPKAGSTVENDFSLTGRYFKYGETITLLFGYGDKITERIRVKLSRSKYPKPEVARYWAQKKIDFLQNDTEKNRKEIIATGVKHSLVTDYTSLIVLDEVEDYIRYNITPPEELMDAYHKMRQLKKKWTRSGVPPIPSIERIEIIEDAMEVEEQVIMSTESDLNESIIESIIEIDEEDEAIMEDIPFVVLEESPVFPGCNGTEAANKLCFSKGIQEHIKKHFNSAVFLNASGTSASVMFTVNREGYIRFIRVRAANRTIEEEVRRVVQLLPKMIPGKQRGRPVDVKYSFPLVYGTSRKVEGETFLNSNIPIRGTVVNTTPRPSYKKYKGSLYVKDRKLTAPYLTALDLAKNKEQAYTMYLKQRENYAESPAYFVDVFNYFKERFGDGALAYRILSNIAETEMDNYELLKVFAYQLEKEKRNTTALYIYKQILKLRTEDAQSYRDVGLASATVGESKDALEFYTQIISRELYKNSERRVFTGIENVCKNEVRQLLQQQPHLDTSNIPKEVQEPVNYDLRVLVDWNHNDTDIDLHIIDPNLEECYYSHKNTSIGGHISQDMTQGFGPEEFTLKHAIKGNYFIKINYYGDRYQKIENPTFMKVTVFKYYGSKKQTKSIQIIRLTRNDKKEIVGKVRF